MVSEQIHIMLRIRLFIQKKFDIETTIKMLFIQLYTRILSSYFYEIDHIIFMMMLDDFKIL